MKKIEHKHFSSIDSTNTWARKNAPQLSHDAITVVTASEQTGGRGRFDRQWISPPNKNIYASFCFFLQQNASISNISQLLATSASKALEKLGFHLQLKWPNDLFLANKKVGGILCEAIYQGNITFVIAGIGINVNMTQEQIEKVGRPATSLAIESNKIFDLNTVMHELEKQFTHDLEIFLSKGFNPFLSLFTQGLSHKVGDKLRFQSSKGIWEGTFHSINSDGSLNLSLISGEVKNFISGEIL